MREIKFRAWIPEKNAFADSCCVYSDGSFEATVEVFSEVLGHHDVSGEYDGMILNQYTGLKDANGVEIYEGDIVESWYPQIQSIGSSPILCQVRFGHWKTEWDFNCDPEGMGWYLQGRVNYGHGPSGYCESIMRQHPHIRAIGNIYENPELLK